MTDAAPPILAADDATYGFPGRPQFLRPLRLDIARGQCWGIVGPNGAGKSTVLRLLAGMIAPHRGAIRLNGQDLRSVSARRLARCIAFMPQQLARDLNVTARQIVLLGRFPHRSLGLFESAEDFVAADRALATTQTDVFAHRLVSTLSGGEAQRVHVAAAIAQEPAVLLLDEPTAALDLQHQLRIFNILRDLAAGGMAVVVVTHDLNLAARFCTHVLLLDNGMPVSTGPPSHVLNVDRLEPIYGVRLSATPMAQPPGRWIVPLEPADRPGGAA